AEELDKPTPTTLEIEILTDSKESSSTQNTLQQEKEILSSTKLKNHKMITSSQSMQRLNKITNIYVPSKSEDRVCFFGNWTPPIAEKRICIIAGDFNTNLDPQNDRISNAPVQPDHSKDLVQTLLADYTNTVLFAKESPFLTFYKSTHNGQK
ncbi:17514_t:CDS:2, partial [Gigaspora rosea]